MSHSFKASKTYRFFSTPSENNSKNLLVALHGYGQLAAFFIKKFNSCSNEYTILAPEGPHRFYKNGYSGRVGASWMTKEAREDDIKDNINWLTEWLVNHLKQNTYDKIILLGFSQGGATAARWYHNDPGQFDQLILWASIFPPDISKPKIKLPNKNLFVVGKNDEFINDEMRSNEVKFYQNIGFDTHIYDGNHDIDPFVLQQILK